MYSKHNFFLLLTLALIAGTVACINIAAGCGNDLVKEVPSPNGKMKAVVFQRDCGATTGFSTQISLCHLTTRYRTKAEISLSPLPITAMLRLALGVVPWLNFRGQTIRTCWSGMTSMLAFPNAKNRSAVLTSVTKHSPPDVCAQQRLDQSAGSIFLNLIN